jgi:serine/threonine-protein kinase
MTEAAQSSLPTLLKEALGDSYTIEGEIGRGGMGVVYRARDERLQRRVAVKVLPPELAFQREIRQRFTREAQTAARLSHPHIVPIHDVGEGQGLVYFVMGLIEGESLAARIRRRGRIPPEEARRIMKETADALSAAHAMSVIHRDIKPDNVLLEGTRGRVIVTDFGIAKALSAAGGSTLTSAGMAIGTPSFMSPEQAAGEKEIDGRSDIYSLGVVSYQMLSGELPFTAPTVAGILMKHITEPARLLHEQFTDSPEDLSLAVARCLEKDPENRWPSADALRRSLESRNVAGYRPTGLGWRAATRPGGAPERGSTGRAVRPIGERPLRRPPGERSPRPLTDRSGRQRSGSDRPMGGVELARDTMRAARRNAAHRRKPDEMALPETGEPKVVRQARAEFAKFAAVFGGCFMLNVATGFDFPWSLIVGGAMSFSFFKKYAELWQAGYSWRDILHRPDAPDAIGAGAGPRRLKGGRQVAAPRAEELGRQYARMMEVHADRVAVIGLYQKLGEADRAMVPDLVETVDNLYSKAVELGTALHAMDTSLAPNELARIDEQLEHLRGREENDERNRQMSLLERQRKSCVDLAEKRAMMAERFVSCALAIQNLRFEVLRLREKGIGAVGSELTQATQQARALSRDIDHAIGAAAEVREAMS